MRKRTKCANHAPRHVPGTTQRWNAAFGQQDSRVAQTPGADAGGHASEALVVTFVARSVEVTTQVENGAVQSASVVHGCVQSTAEERLHVVAPSARFRQLLQPGGQTAEQTKQVPLLQLGRSPLPHDPQARAPPQPSLIGPQILPCAAQVVQRQAPTVAPCAR